MTIQKIGGSWYSTEVTLEEALGYGDYIFTTLGRLDQLDPNVVLGLFLWQYGACYKTEYMWWNPYNEIDVEFSRWGDEENDIGQFVAQPWDYYGNMSRFDATFSEGELTSHAFRWLSDRVEFRSWRGGPGDEIPANMIHSWTYTGPHIPRPEQPRIHINFWQYSGLPDTCQEVVIDEFTFVSDEIAGAPEDFTISTVSHLWAAVPNPFSSETAIRHTLTKGGDTQIVIYDVLGRRVRTLVNGFVRAGEHDVVWDGRDDSGSELAPGTYLYRLRTDDVVETRKLILLK
jgi:hypothetical protein